MTNKQDCKHGQLERSCEICERDSKIAELCRMVENLKCCGNCMHYHNNKAVPCMEWPYWNECCKHWEWDDWTVEDRRAGE